MWLQGTEALPGDRLLGAGQEEAEFSYESLARTNWGQTQPARIEPALTQVSPAPATDRSPLLSPVCGQALTQARPNLAPARVSAPSADPKLRPRPPLAPCGLSPGSRPPWVALAGVRHRGPGRRRLTLLSVTSSPPALSTGLGPAQESGVQAGGATGTWLASAEAGARPPGRPTAGRALLCGSVPRPAPRACVASPGSQRAQRDRASDFRARPVRDPSQSGRRPVTAWWKDTLAWRHGCPPGGRGCLDGGLRWGGRTCSPLGWEVRAGSGPRGGSGGHPGLCGPCSHLLGLPEPPRVRLGICWGGGLFI